MMRNFLRKRLKKNNFRKSSFVLSVVLLFAVLFAASYIIGERYYTKQNEEPGKSVFGIIYPEKYSFEDEIIIYDTMHRMANSKISAKKSDSSGKLEINQKQINAVRTIVYKMNYPDKSFILEALEKWEKGDFSLIEDEHNYFSDRLGETSLDGQKTR
jgi:cytoskeletal protein RodZ